MSSEAAWPPCPGQPSSRDMVSDCRDELRVPSDGDNQSVISDLNVEDYKLVEADRQAELVQQRLRLALMAPSKTLLPRCYNAIDRLLEDHGTLLRPDTTETLMELYRQLVTKADVAVSSPQVEATSPSVSANAGQQQLGGNYASSPPQLGYVTLPDSTTERTPPGSYLMLPAKRPSRVRLEEVPRYDGHPSSWKRFAQLFEDAVGSDPNLSEAIKLDTLSKVVSGHSQAVLSYNIWSEAIRGLGQDIASEPAVKNDIYRLAAQISDVPSKPTLEHWTKLAEHTRNMKRVSAPYDPTLQMQVHAIVQRKMGRFEAEYDFVKRNANLDDLLAFIEKKIRGLRKVEEKNALLGTTVASAAPARTPRVGRTHTTAAVTTTGTGSPVPCFFCDGNHLRKACPLSKPERKQGLRQRGRCFGCLKIREQGHQCTNRCRNCQTSSLHSLICPCPPTQATAADEHQPREVVTSLVLGQHLQGSSGSKVASDSKPSDVYLPTLQVKTARDAGQSPVLARVLLDSGSTASFISADLVERLGLHREPIPCTSVRPFGGASRIKVNQRVQVRLQSTTDPTVEDTVSLLVMAGTLVGRLPAVPPELQEMALTSGVTLTESGDLPEGAVIDLLFGADLTVSVFLKDCSRTLKPTPSMAFVETRYGWYAQGTMVGGSHQGPGESLTFLAILDTSDVIAPAQGESKPCLCSDLRQMLSQTPDAGGGDRLQEEWLQGYNASIEHDASLGRFVAPLPWTATHRPDRNYYIAEAMASSQHRRLQRDATLDVYTAALKDFLDKGYAERLPSPMPRDGYWIPHFPVFKENSTTPVRPVFNASAAARGSLSLNECIFKGVWRQTQLLDVLLKWHLNPMVLMADIKQAFLQIKVHPSDRKYLRFIWFENGETTGYQMTSLLFGASSSPFILHAVLLRLFESRAPELLHIVYDTYMDDSMLFAETTEELQSLVKRVTEVMAIGSFQLHKWTTLPHIASRLGLESKRGDATCLGVGWCLEEDQIKFKQPELEPGPLTRRRLASIFAKPFDPMGLLGPFHTRAKLFLKSVILENVDWDAAILPELDCEAQSLIEDLQYLQDIKLPRVVRTSQDYEVWCFGDASATAYGVCLYVHDRQNKNTHLLLSRGHTASHNKTIPQLELVAAVLAAETYQSMRRCLPSPPAQVRFFTDSQVTWHRLRANPSKHEAYVATRVLRINKVSSPKDWYYIASGLNPADLVSRGVSLRLLRANQLWFHGPPVEVIQDAEGQTRALAERPTLANVIVQDNATFEAGRVDEILDRLLRGMSYNTFRSFVRRVLRHMDKYAAVVKRHMNSSDSIELYGDLQVWKCIQRVVLARERHALHTGSELPESSPFRNQPLHLDDYGLVRLSRRLQFSDLPEEVKFPLVLVDHPVVRSYIRHVHVGQARHAGASTTGFMVKQVVHLPNAARIVQQEVQRCLTCRRNRTAKVPFSVPMAPLPADRVLPGHAFQVVGIDLFGPLHNNSGQLLKYYGLIFVCAKSRAVHLELVESKATSDILRAYERFVAQYGTPELVRSDNERSFHKLNKTLTALYQLYDKAVGQLRDAAGAQTKWIFNVERAPWFGGFWERLIQNVKRAIDRMRLSQAETYEQILTVLREAQLMVNSRPLLYRAEAFPLTPGHLVYGRPLNHLPPVRIPKTQKDDVVVDYARLQLQLDQFWRIWREEYLPSLRTHNWGKTGTPVLNELVLIQDPNLPRYQWEMGRITRLITGRDDYVRTVEVEALEGGVRRRAIHKVIPLETLAAPREDVAEQGSRQSSDLEL